MVARTRLKASIARSRCSGASPADIWQRYARLSLRDERGAETCDGQSPSASIKSLFYA